MSDKSHPLKSLVSGITETLIRQIQQVFKAVLSLQITSCKLAHNFLGLGL